MVRIKERYLLVNIVYPPDAAQSARASIPDFVVLHQPTVDKLTPPALSKAIRAQVAALFGDYGAGSLEGRLSVKYLSLATSTFILRCARSHYRMLWAALTLMNRVPVNDGRPCIFRVVRVSGTMRKAEEEAIRQARTLILAAKQREARSLSLATHAAAPDDVQDQLMLDVEADSSDMGHDDGDCDDDG